MSRYFAPITKEELAQKILKAGLANPDRSMDLKELCEPQFSTDAPLDPNDAIKIVEKKGYHLKLVWLTSKIKSDVNKVDFSDENLECNPSNVDSYFEHIIGFNTLPNNLTYLGVYAGGDWEIPLFFIIYFDGKDLRAYIPSEGNTWNKTTKKAFGNDDGNFDSPEDEAESHGGTDLNPEDIIEDITARILSKDGSSTPSKAATPNFSYAFDIRCEEGHSMSKISLDVSNVNGDNIYFRFTKKGTLISHDSCNFVTMTKQDLVAMRAMQFDYSDYRNMSWACDVEEDECHADVTYTDGTKDDTHHSAGKFFERIIKGEIKII